MEGKQLGYVRVSSADQHADRQLAGHRLERVFSDYTSGRDRSRPQLSELLLYAREGDTLNVHSMDRLARNLDDLRAIVRQLTDKGVKVMFWKENLLFTGEDSPMSTLLLSVMGAFAEFERSLIKERQREGIALAKQKGVYKGRKPALSAQQVDNLLYNLRCGMSRSAAAKAMGISRSTVYKHLRAHHQDHAASTTPLSTSETQ